MTRLALPTAVLAAALGGCLSLGGGGSARDVSVAADSGVRGDTRMTQVELDQLCLAFAERYLTVVGIGCNRIENSVGEPPRKQRAHSFKLQTASSVYDIVTTSNPFAKLMDLILLAELQHLVWGVEGVAEKVFGSQAAPFLMDALERGKEEVWTVGDRVLKPDQRKVVEGMIREWRRLNPTPEAIAFVRFGDFAQYRGKSILDGIPLGSGLLAPVSEATRSLEESRLLAERGLFLMKRMPLLLRWHAESYLNTVFVKPEIRRLIDSADRITGVFESLPGKVSEERAILARTLEEREKTVGPVVKDVKAITGDIRDTAKQSEVLLKEVQTTIRAAGDLAGRFEKPAEERDPDKRPFDIREYTEAVHEATRAIREMQTLVREGGTLLDSPAWSRRVTDVNRAAHERVAHAGDEARRWTLFATVCAAGLLILATVLAFTYRFVSPRLPRPAPPAEK